MISICDIQHSFQNASKTNKTHIAIVRDDLSIGDANWVHPYNAKAEIKNGETIKLPIVFNAIPIFENNPLTDDCTKIQPHNFDHLTNLAIKDNEEDF